MAHQIEEVYAPPGQMTSTHEEYMIVKQIPDYKELNAFSSNRKRDK